MNIFILDRNPVIAAESQCDRHVVKMVLESAQLLSSAFPPEVPRPKNVEEEPGPYRITHENHPCSAWTRQCQGNFDWLVEHGLALAHEYEHRYERKHASRVVIEWCDSNWRKAGLPPGAKTEFVQAMPAKYKHSDPVAAYRGYYLGEKAYFAAWNHGRTPPAWWSPKEHP